MGKRYRFMCGGCYHKIEADLLAFKASCGNSLDTDQIDVIARQLIRLNAV
jgi:hypothetical protein